MDGGPRLRGAHDRDRPPRPHRQRVLAGGEARLSPARRLRAAKAGVILLTQVLAQELGPAGITVNAVCPGTVDTDLLNKDRQFEQLVGALEGSLERWMAREIPLGRLETADDVAAAIAFLCSDDAAYVTGEALNVSGGQTMV